MKKTIEAQVSIIKNTTGGKRILFACVPGDGHFNPLTGIAKHLQLMGYDVAFYSSEQYRHKVEKMDMAFFPFDKAPEITTENFREVFPGREKLKGMVSKLNFDIEHFFIRRGPEYYQDLVNIQKKFSFDIVVADCCFTAIPFVVQKMKIPAIAVGVAPLMAASKDLAPYGLGMTPKYSWIGKIKQAGLRWVAKNVLFKKANKVLAEMCAENQLNYNGQNVFDYIFDECSHFLQSATPGFEYTRSDLPSRVTYAGPLLPYQHGTIQSPWFDERLNKFSKIVLVTQGTAEPDVTKLIIPTLEAFKNTNVLVVVTTAGNQTQELRQTYTHHNIIIEDFIPYHFIMPYVDVYITNGGYGGTLLGIQHQLPMVVAGVHEGKSEICARVGYFKLGINLRTERPVPYQVKRAVADVMGDAMYKENVSRLCSEFSQYNPGEITARTIENVMAAGVAVA